MGKTLAACALLGAALYLFLYSCMATASDAQGALIFAVTLVPILGFLGAAAWFARGAMPVLRAAQGGLVFVAAFFFLSFVPGLNVLPADVVGVVAVGYKLVYGVTPYEAHRPENVTALLQKSLEAQGGNTMDLRGFHLKRDWQRLCLFGPYTSDEAAVKAGNLPPEWPLSLYSKVGINDGVTALALVGDRYPVSVVDLPRNRFDFAPAALDRCYAREEARFQRGSSGTFTSSPRPSP